MKLSQLIRKIRNCKTQSAERKLVLRESASIREDLSRQRYPQKLRARNVAKLIYIHTLGYPTHFGQMEAVKLMSSMNYGEKRIGYLALTILLDETVEILPLIEHTLKKDLEDDNHYVKSLALTTIANIASEDLCRDLTVHIEDLLLRAPPHLQKKALLCAGRICERCPEFVENYLSKLGGLLSSSSHGVLGATVGFMKDLVKFESERRHRHRRNLLEESDDEDGMMMSKKKKKRLMKALEGDEPDPDSDSGADSDDELSGDKLKLRFMKYIGRLSKLLRGLLHGKPASRSPSRRHHRASGGGSQSSSQSEYFDSRSSTIGEYEANGICDPFLMVQILDLFRTLGHASVVASGKMTDVLSEVPERIERCAGGGKKWLKSSPACAVLFQTVETILGIEAEQSLRRLALDILEKFVHARRDNNLRYLALHALRRVVQRYKDLEFVARFGDVVVDCLKSPDVSIRNRTVELICEMVNGQNIRFLVGELITYLHSSPDDTMLPLRIYRLIHKFCKDASDEAEVSWKVNSMIRVILAAGSNLRSEIASGFVRMVVNELATLPQKKRTLRKLEMALRKIKAKPTLVNKQNPMIQVCVWCVGEFASLIPPKGLVIISQEEEDKKSNIVQLLVSIFRTTETSTKTKLYVLTALAKVSAAYEGVVPDAGERIGKFYDAVIERYENVQIQSRARLLKSILMAREDLRKAVLAQMPEFGEDEDEDGGSEQKVGKTQEEEQEEEEGEVVEGRPSEEPSLLPMDLLQQGGDQPGSEVRVASILDLLTTGGGSEVDAVVPPAAAASSTEDQGPPTLADLFAAPTPSPVIPDLDSLMMQPMAPTVGPEGAPLKEEMTVFEDPELKVEFELVKSPTDARLTLITAHLSNKTVADFQNLTFRVSVPGYLKRNVEDPSSPTLTALSQRGSSVRFKILNTSSPKKRIIVRFKLEYTRSDYEEKIVKVHPVKNIPMKF